MLPFHPKPLAEEPDPSNATADTPRKQTMTVGPLIREDDPVDLDEPLSQPALAQCEIPPIADYETPSVAPSEAASSSYGGTFSSLTEGTFREMSRWTATPPRPLLGFKSYVVYNSDIRTLPLEIEGYPEVSDSRAPPPCPLPWLYEFSWTSGAILFAGDPLNTAQVGRRSSELGDATFGDYMERSATIPADDVTCKSAGEVTCKSMDSVTLRRAVFERGEVVKEIEERRTYLLDQLEAYWRSHAPQRSAKRDKGKAPTHQAGQYPYTRTTNLSYRKRGCTGGQRKISQGSGDGDEDEGDEGDSTTPSISSTSNTENHWYACPYQKWKPQHYIFECGTGFGRVTDVKNHLLKKHYKITCPRCRDVYDDKHLLRLHLSKGCGKPPRSQPDACIMNDRQKAIIEARLDQRMPYHQQWGFLFRTLFPNDPLPASIYLLPQQEEFRNYLQSWVLSVGKKVLDDIHRQTSLDIPDLNQHESKETQLGGVMARFITLRLQQDVSLERLHADFARAQQDFERSLWSTTSVSAATNNQSSTTTALPLTHDAIGQIPALTLTQPEPDLSWPTPTMAAHAMGGRASFLEYPNSNSGILNRNFAAHDCPIPVNLSSGLSEVAGNPYDDLCTSAVWGGQRPPPNTEDPGIPGIDLPGPSSVAEWTGGYLPESFTCPSFSRPMQEAVPGSSASASVSVNDYLRPLTVWNPVGRNENWCLLDNSFSHGLGSWRTVDGGMMGDWRGGLQPISETAEQ